MPTRKGVVEAVDARLPYLMIAPAIALIVGLVAYPIVWAVRLSLFAIPTYNLEDRTFVGLAHYRALLTDPLFYDVLVNTLVFVFASVIGQLGIGLGLALLLEDGWLRDEFARVFRGIYILPWATTGVIVAFSWTFMFEPRVGLVNEALRLVGMSEPPSWFQSVQWAMIAVIVANVWRGTPFSLIFQTSGLQSIPRHLFEAAAVGGASRLQTIRYVTIPQLRPFIVVNLILITLFTVTVFDIIFVMTGGGPLRATEVLSIHMYRTTFELGAFGRGSALAVILFGLNIGLVGLYLFALGGTEDLHR